MKSKIGIFFILAGILIIAGALWIRWDSEQNEKKLIDEFNSTAAAFDEESAEAADAYGSAAPSSDPGKVANVIALMTIPRISLTVPVAEGVDNASLKYAVGHFTGTPLPGEKGNCSIAGHRSYTYNQYFNRLDEVNIGDTITVKTQKGQFEYTVCEKKIVEPTDLSVISETDDSTITLITCHPERSSAYRLIVKGRLTSSGPAGQGDR